MNKNEQRAVFTMDVCMAKEMQKDLPEDETFNLVSSFFKVLGDPTRAKIIFLLQQREMCVGDVCAVLEMSPSAVSHQLSILRSANLVKYRREGKNVYYMLSDDHVRGMFASGLEHIHE